MLDSDGVQFVRARATLSSYSIQFLQTALLVSIKEAFVGPAGLSQALHAVKLEQIYSREQVRKVCRRSNGYQPHLLSPEKGIKQLVKECMQLMEPASTKCVRDVTLHALETDLQDAGIDAVQVQVPAAGN